MKTTLVKSLAASLFVFATGGVLAASVLQDEQKWFTVDDTGLNTPLDEAPCSGTPQIECAQLYERENSSKPWSPAVDENGDPIMAYGDRTD